VMTNNIVNTAVYGITGDSVGGSAATAVAKYFPDGYFADNLFVSCGSQSTYPAGNYFPSGYSAVGFSDLAGGDYRLATTCEYKGAGTDGTDPGADIDALNAAQGTPAPPPLPPPPSDYAPTVSIASPTAGTSFTAPATITIVATATDGDASPVAKVEFYSNGTLAATATSSPYTVVLSNAPAGTYSLVAVATDTAGLRTTSASVAITVAASTGGGTTALPTGWIDDDVGATGMAGSASYASGTFTVKGAGADVWGTADSFNYAHQALSGDGQIVARVTALQNTNAYAKGGVMLRETGNAGSIHVLLDAKPGGGVEMLVRTSTGGSTTYLAGNSAGIPVWLKLVRTGTKVTGYTSTDGTTWTTVGTATVTMATSIVAGLAVCSHNTAALNTATFDNVSASVAAPPPPSTVSPLADRDIGSVGMPGSLSYSGGTYTIKGAGADVWGTADSFNLAYQALNGDGQVVARVSSMQNTNAYAKAGVMIRQSMTVGSPHVLLDVKPGGGTELLARTSNGGATSYIAGGSGAAPMWLKLVRSGTTITASSSSNGSLWTTVGKATVSMTATVYVGLAVCSHNATVLNTSTFDNVTIGATAVTPTYADADIGAVGLKGSSSLSGGVYTLKGAGADVWGIADSFHFTYQPLNGDGQLVARLTSMQNTNSYAKAGIMVRESLNANAANLLLDVRPAGGVEALARTAAGSSTSFVAGGTTTTPVWLKIVRAGTTVTGSISRDGVTWTTVASRSVPMAANVYVGLAVCSHDTRALNTATFDNVSFK